MLKRLREAIWAARTSPDEKFDVDTDIVPLDYAMLPPDVGDADSRAADDSPEPEETQEEPS